MCPKGTLSRARSTVPKKCVCCTKGKGSPVGDHCFTLLISPQAVALARPRRRRRPRRRPRRPPPQPNSNPTLTGTLTLSPTPVSRNPT